jgi:hypothetical protein
MTLASTAVYSQLARADETCFGKSGNILDVGNGPTGIKSSHISSRPRMLAELKTRHVTVRDEEKVVGHTRSPSPLCHTRHMASAPQLSTITVKTPCYTYCQPRVSCFCLPQVKSTNVLANNCLSAGKPRQSLPGNLLASPDSRTSESPFNDNHTSRSPRRLIF